MINFLHIEHGWGGKVVRIIGSFLWNPGKEGPGLYRRQWKNLEMRCSSIGSSVYYSPGPMTVMADERHVTGPLAIVSSPLMS